MNNSNQGHRKRLWARYLKNDFRQAFPHAYEKLEFLLTFAIPRKDVKPIAKALIARFGSLNGVLTAPAHKLEEIEGMGQKSAAFLNILHQVNLAQDEEALACRDLMNHPELVKSWLQRELAWEEVEFLMVLYLDGPGRLIHWQRLFRGTVDRVQNHPRELAKEALARNAVNVIIAHNHPSGRPEATLADQEATARMAAALQTVAVSLLDHFIVAREGVVSMAQEGLMPR